MDNRLIPLTVVDVDRNTADIAVITLTTADGAPLPGYEPGCHADFHLTAKSGEDLVRQYSLFPMTPNTSNEGRYGITVKVEPDSRGGSEALYDLEAGETVNISAPRNNFGLAQDAQHSILIGAGVGIAPIYSLARGLSRQAADFSVIYFASSAERAVLSHLFDEYCAYKTRNVFATGAREQQGRIVREALHPLTSVAGASHLYVCGPQGFMETVREVAAEYLPPENIHWEAFRPEEKKLQGTALADAPFTVTFRDETFTIPADKSVLDVFEDEDFPIMSQCAEGTCGTCVMRVVDGTPDHRDSVFTAEQHESGAFATCVSRALSDNLTLERWRNAI